MMRMDLNEDAVRNAYSQARASHDRDLQNRIATSEAVRVAASRSSDVTQLTSRNPTPTVPDSL